MTLWKPWRMFLRARRKAVEWLTSFLHAVGMATGLLWRPMNRPAVQMFLPFLLLGAAAVLGITGKLTGRMGEFNDAVLALGVAGLLASGWLGYVTLRRVVDQSGDRNRRAK